MKLLVDEQLPPALAAWLRGQGCEASHVRELGLARGKDRQIWAQAAALGAAVITKDEDYVALSRVRAGEVAVVWVRVGNCTNSALLCWFGPLWPEIRRRLEVGEQLIEVR
ncbi:MAG: hypothetical protein RL514_3744 [Verrucomicrobiota bacterium]